MSIRKLEKGVGPWWYSFCSFVLNEWSVRGMRISHCWYVILLIHIPFWQHLLQPKYPVHSFTFFTIARAGQSQAMQRRRIATFLPLTRTPSRTTTLNSAINHPKIQDFVACCYQRLMRLEIWLADLDEQHTILATPHAFRCALEELHSICIARDFNVITIFFELALQQGHQLRFYA